MSIEEKAINNLKQYIEEDKIYQSYKNKTQNNFSDFDMFCINHCLDIENLINLVSSLKDR